MTHLCFSQQLIRVSFRFPSHSNFTAIEKEKVAHVHTKLVFRVLETRFILNLRSRWKCMFHITAKISLIPGNPLPGFPLNRKLGGLNNQRFRADKNLLLQPVTETRLSCFPARRLVRIHWYPSPLLFSWSMRQMKCVISDAVTNYSDKRKKQVPPQSQYIPARHSVSYSVTPVKFGL